jgi:hypothetical protein
MFRRILSIAAVTGATAILIASTAVADFTLTRLTDDSEDAMTSQVERPLALDVFERPHIAFWNRLGPGSEGVFHAWYDGTWHIHTVHTDSVWNGSPALASAADASVRVVFNQWTEGGTEIRYVPVYDDSVGTQEVPFAGGYHEVPSIAVDRDGWAHVVCTSSGGLEYTWRGPGGWMNPHSIGSGHGSIAVDSLGECHVAYEMQDESHTTQVYYVHGTGAYWYPSELLAGGYPYGARSPSIVVDPNGRVLVAYEVQTESDHGIEMRIRSNGSWSAPEWVAQGVAPCVALSPGGYPCVVHWGLWGYGVVVSYRQASPPWSTTPVDPEAVCRFEVYFRPGIAVTSEGRVHVAYCSTDPRGGEDSELWHATIEELTAAGLDAGAAPGLRLDPLGNPARQRVRLRYELPSAGPVSLNVYDIRGRLVAALLREFRETGAHLSAWDGRDSRGCRVASGVYVLRLSTQTGMTARKVVVQP